MAKKMQTPLWHLMLVLLIGVFALSVTVVACGDDDDDDDSSSSDDDDDDTSDDDADDDDDDDDDTTDDDDDDDDDTAGSTDFGGTVVDFKEGTILPGATVELLNNDTGASFEPALTQVADADGKVLFEDIPAAKAGQVAAKVTLGDYRTTVQFHFDTGTASEEILAVSESTVKLIATLLGEDVDDGQGFASGAVYWVEDDEEKSLGCAEVEAVRDGGGDTGTIYYFKDKKLLGRVPDKTQPYTNPGYTEEGDPLSLFVAVNADPGSYTINATTDEGDGDTESNTIPNLCADCIAITTILFDKSEYPTNPGPETCDD